jgi:hypothetical protein
MTKEQLDQKLRETFQEVKNEKSFVMLLNGHRVKTNSGKQVWTSTGAAKNALNNHIDNLGYSFRDGKEEEIKEWAKSNIQIISSAEYEKMLKAIK